MASWNNFYLQKMDSGETWKESVVDFGMWCKDIPFKIIEKVKDPAKTDWPDEDGDDEYIPAGGLRLAAYTMKVEFGCKKMEGGTDTSAVSDVRAKVGAFINYLRSSGMMRLYSSYTRIGRQMVRLESYDSAKWQSDANGEYLVFEVTFKVNDPVTDVTL